MHIPINRDLVHANQNELRRLTLLAVMCEQGGRGQATSTDQAAETLAPWFPQLPGSIDADIRALKQDGLVASEETLRGGTREAAVTRLGTQVVDDMHATVSTDSDSRVAALSYPVMRYIHTKGVSARNLNTDVLTDEGATLLGRPLPEGSVEEVCKELADLGHIDVSRTWDGHMLIKKLTEQRRDMLREGAPLLLAGRAAAPQPTYVEDNRTYFNGAVNAHQFIGSVSRSSIHQEQKDNEVHAPAEIGFFRAVDALDRHLDGRPDLQEDLDALVTEYKNIVPTQDGDASQRSGVLDRIKRFLFTFVAETGKVAYGYEVEEAVAAAQRSILN